MFGEGNVTPVLSPTQRTYGIHNRILTPLPTQFLLPSLSCRTVSRWKRKFFYPQCFDGGSGLFAVTTQICHTHLTLCSISTPKFVGPDQILIHGIDPQGFGTIAVLQLESGEGEVIAPRHMDSLKVSQAGAKSRAADVLLLAKEFYFCV